ncbi:MAG TPA: hypothetical protein VFX30_03090 [bacterium]|nr:hypothetical protein [bacterium]
MKKGLLMVAVLVFLGGGVALAFAYDRFSSAADYKATIERSMQKISAATDVAAAESESDMMKMDIEMMGNAKRNGMIGLSGGAVLIVASVILFLKSRRPAEA